MTLMYVVCAVAVAVVAVVGVRDTTARRAARARREKEVRDRRELFTSLARTFDSDPTPTSPHGWATSRR